MIANLHSTDRDHVRQVRRVRVWLNDEDVTKECFYADDEAGIVRGYPSVRNSDGKHIGFLLDHAVIERCGTVRIELPGLSE